MINKNVAPIFSIKGALKDVQVHSAMLYIALTHTISTELSAVTSQMVPLLFTLKDVASTITKNNLRY